jgi:hypothetical protein
LRLWSRDAHDDDDDEGASIKVVVEVAAGRAEIEKAKTPARLVLVLLDADDRKKEDIMVDRYYLARTRVVRLPWTCSRLEAEIFGGSDE